MRRALLETLVLQMKNSEQVYINSVLSCVIMYSLTGG